MNHPSENGNISEIDPIILQRLFDIGATPENIPGLMNHSHIFGKKEALQLIFYGTRKLWEWYANLDKECREKDIDSILTTIYTYIRNPTYTSEESNPDVSTVCNMIKKRLSQESGSNEQIETSQAKAHDIF